MGDLKYELLYWLYDLEEVRLGCWPGIPLSLSHSWSLLLLWGEFGLQLLELVRL